MKITSKKLVDHKELVTYIDIYDVRVQLSKGNIITMECNFEDGELQGTEAKTETDKKIYDKLSAATINYLDEIISEIEI